MSGATVVAALFFSFILEVYYITFHKRRAHAYIICHRPVLEIDTVARVLFFQMLRMRVPHCE